MKNLFAAFGLVFFLVFLFPSFSGAAGQMIAESATTDSQRQAGKTNDPAEKYTVESDLVDQPERRIVKWNDYDLKYLTFKWGLYCLFDYGTAAQDDNSKTQVSVPSDIKLRDLRISFSGKFKTRRAITYTCGLMYDDPTKTIRTRETGIQVAIPELWGYVFAGRQKEGFSLSKITVGYAPSPIERMPANDAMIPILGDGFKWLGVHPSKHANWNIGWFNNYFAENPSLNWYDTTIVGRFCWVPMHPDEQQKGTLLHLGAAYRWAKISNDTLRLKSRPESYTAPYFLDTGDFPADSNDMVGFEMYYRPGSWMYGGEYFLNKVNSSQTGNPFFHGGEAMVAYIFTGETRPYLDIGGKMGFIYPEKSVFHGGPGAVEGLLHYSYSDFDSGPVNGGIFWRLTPQINWYLDSRVKVACAYGIGSLDRYGIKGITQFFQLRLQLQFI